jgi:hypothetical protein
MYAGAAHTAKPPADASQAALPCLHYGLSSGIAAARAGKRHGIAAICYVAVTALTERFWQNPTNPKFVPTAASE